MNRRGIAGLFLAGMMICGCSTSLEPIKSRSIGARTEVFREIQEGDAIPHGYAELRVVSSLKTHRQGVYPLRKDTHGTPDYALLLTIDGQTAQIKGNLADENCEPRRLRDPEAGDGIRCTFRTVVRLKEGTHMIGVASPDDEAAAELEIALAEGGRYTLTLEPVYGSTTGSGQPAFYGATGFLEGVRGFRMVLQGNH